MKASEDLIPEYLLGTLPAAERRGFEETLAASPALQRQVDALAEALALAAAQAVAQSPVAPAPPALRARLLATVAGVDRFAPFLDDLSRLFELPADAIRAVLARIDDPRAGWQRRLAGVALETSELFHFAVGPTLAAGGAAGGVLRIRAGGSFPAHHHDGDETSYVLEGACDVDGHALGPGAIIEMKRGSTHDCRATPERDLVVMVLHHGIMLAR
jgi:quercetin dioxygenase-like cupin family protein